MRGPDGGLGGDRAECWSSRFSYIRRSPTGSSLVTRRTLCVPLPTGPILVTGLLSPAETIHYGSLARARTKSCSTARGSLFVLGLAVAANSRSHGPDGWKEVRADRTSRQLGLKQWPVKCQKWQGRVVVELPGNHVRMAPGAPETVLACSRKAPLTEGTRK